MALFDHHATFEQAANAVQAGDLEQAEAICQQLLKRNSRDVNALQLQGVGVALVALQQLPADRFGLLEIARPVEARRLLERRVWAV